MLRAAPSDLSAAFRGGGSVSETLWSGGKERSIARIAAQIGDIHSLSKLSYSLSYSVNQHSFFVDSEFIRESGEDEGLAYYENAGPDDVRIKIEPANKIEGAPYYNIYLPVTDLNRSQSILSQKRDINLFYAISWLAGKFEAIQIFSDWSFGRRASFRRAQDPTGITHKLLDDGSNFVIFVNKVQFEKELELNKALSRFLPRFISVKTLVSDGFASMHFRESGLDRTIAASRLSDGTLRFLAIVATLLHPEPPSLLCIEEPELGMHPDAAALLAELLVEASQRMQIIVTTHSEAFLSALTRHDVNVLVTENFGQGTEVTQVDQEQLASWLDEYTLGDLWRIGKIGGNP